MLNDYEFVTVRNISKNFESVKVLFNISFGVKRGEILSLLGPSGCGKTTLLRCVSGLESPEKGFIAIGGEVVTDTTKDIELPPEQRSIGMVFQSYAIWPHMTVFQNVAFPLKLRRENRELIKEKVNKTLSLVGLEDFGNRSATKLSGGQQQRVALARALIAEPQLVLFDEPLSNLDAKLREYMRVELLSLQKRLGFTAIYVTHDQNEALALSNQIIIMNSGKIEQKGTPKETYRKPKTPFVADFMGASNFINGHVISKKDPCYVEVELEGIDHNLICIENNDLKKGTPVIISFRPENAKIIKMEDKKKFNENISEMNCLLGQVTAALFLGEYFEYSIKIGKFDIKICSDSVNEISLETKVYVNIDADKCLAIPAPEKK